MVSAYIGLGSNVGDRRTMLDSACQALVMDGISVSAVSSYVETEPVGPVEQGAFLNAAAQVHTDLAARELLEQLLLIEREHGRDRTASPRWGPRTLDLDLLLYGEAIIDEPGLAVPHPRMHERVFVLQPLAEIASEVRHPVLQLTIRELLERAQAGMRRV